jgi:transcriptional regulator with XRE-family HTH domain
MKQQPNNLKALRLAAGLTGHQAAQAVGLTRTDSIYAAESGRKSLGAEMLRKLAKVYGCDFVDAQPARLVARKPNPKVRR